jgi:hemerythrin-like domain-containing protein
MPRPLTITDPSSLPAPGFDQPFEMLEACHGKIRQMLALTNRIRRHVAQHGSDAQARTAAQDVIRYFDLAAPHHHLDEELHVLPGLEASGDDKLVQLAHRLRIEHRELEQGWAAVRPILAAIAEGTLASLQPAQEQHLASLAELYARHITAEEEVALPAGRATLDAAGLVAMATDMRQRRGVK